ncbi:hypothetical protein BGZ63DRAFT_356746 [Mariannaea sp. PMI_226]|nr:hypothetical protein BGZ63DRAFT_356746 [Mariannaea sp. PMI_226]
MDGLRAQLGLGGVARRTLGLACLMVTVLLWTLYNFLASYIFSDSSFDKPFFLVYFNTSIFAISLTPRFFKYMRRGGIRGLKQDAQHHWNEYRHPTPRRSTPENEDDTDGDRLLNGYNGLEPVAKKVEKLNFRETAVISLEFSMLWFLANYFSSACLQYTSVASTTILTSTSSMWTLIFCVLARLELFTVRKLIGVGASLAGVILISTVDMSGKSDEDRGSFPDKTAAQVAIGDLMALVSAGIYGLYVTVMKRRVGDEDRVDMQLFFGLVGLFNLVLLWPIFFILHWTGLEPFDLPPTSKIWTIIIANALGSFISDISWAYALLLTTPLVVTVGLSLTIPLSLIGQIIQYSQYSSFMYWVGAVIVFASFLIVNHESHDASDANGDNAEQSNRDIVV